MDWMVLVMTAFRLSFESIGHLVAIATSIVCHSNLGPIPEPFFVQLHTDGCLLGGILQTQEQRWATAAAGPAGPTNEAHTQGKLQGTAPGPTAHARAQGRLQGTAQIPSATTCFSSPYLAALVLSGG